MKKNTVLAEILVFSTCLSWAAAAPPPGPPGSPLNDSNYDYYDYNYYDYEEEAERLKEEEEDRMCKGIQEMLKEHGYDSNRRPGIVTRRK